MSDLIERMMRKRHRNIKMKFHLNQHPQSLILSAISNITKERRDKVRGAKELNFSPKHRFDDAS